MKGFGTLTIVLLAAAFMFSANVKADVPQRITYQGVLSDSTGAAIPDDVYLIKFIIWDDPTATGGGNEKWNSGFQNINTVGGLFSYDLGSNVALPDDLFATDTSRWLGITVNTDPEISPRTKINTEAFAYQALRADSAGTLGGQPPAYYLAWGNLTGVPAGFADGVDDDAGGDITAVTAGSGLSGGGSSGAVSLFVPTNGITSTHVLDGTIRDFDILDETGVAQSVESAAITYLGDSPEIVDTKTINCPSSGYVLAIYSAEFSFSHVNGASSVYTMWLSSNGTIIDGSISKNIRWPADMPTGSPDMIVSLNYIFTVSSGNKTINVVIDSNPGDPDYVIDDRVLSLVFIPTAYGTLSKSGASSDPLEIETENEVIE